MAGDPISLSSAPGTLLLNQQIANTRYGTANQQPTDQPLHALLVDIYDPPGDITIAYGVRHGGTDTKGRMANQLLLAEGVPSSRSTQWSRLTSNKCAAWLVQGGHCTPENAGPWNPNGVNTVHLPDYPNGVSGWSSHSYWSGYDDPQFSIDMSKSMLARYGSGTVRVSLGHSEGGMMVSRDWHDHKAGGFHVHASVSGPPSKWHQANPALPAIPTPYYAQVSLNDANIGIAGGHFLDPIWVGSLNTTLSQQTFPVELISELVYMQQRVNAYNTAHALPPETVNLADGVTTAVTLGTKTTLVYSGGANVLVIYSQPDHSLVNQQKAAGVALLTFLTVFVRSLAL